MNVLHLPRLAGRGLIKAYRYTLSPLVGFHCRHLPTCSEYADEALDRYGLWAGGWMTLARLTRHEDWRRELERNMWSNFYLSSKDARRFLDQQNVELRALMTDIGLAK